MAKAEPRLSVIGSEKSSLPITEKLYMHFLSERGVLLETNPSDWVAYGYQEGLVSRVSIESEFDKAYERAKDSFKPGYFIVEKIGDDDGPDYSALKIT